MLDNEALELLKHGYVRCHYLQLYCSRCGSVRSTVAFIPDDPTIECPRCGQQGCHFGELRIVAAFTRRPLPGRPEVWVSAINKIVLGADDNDEFLARKPKRRRVFGCRGDARVSIKPLPVKVLI